MPDVQLNSEIADKIYTQWDKDRAGISNQEELLAHLDGQISRVAEAGGVSREAIITALNAHIDDIADFKLSDDAVDFPAEMRLNRVIFYAHRDLKKYPEAKVDDADPLNPKTNASAGWPSREAGFAARQLVKKANEPYWPLMNEKRSAQRAEADAKYPGRSRLKPYQSHADKVVAGRDAADKSNQR